MKKLILIILLALGGALTFYKLKKPETPKVHSALQPESFFYMGRCSLLTKDFELIFHYPGSYCHIIPKLGVAVRTENGLTLVNSNNEVIFKIDSIFHHGVYFDEQRKWLFVLTASDEEISPGDFAIVTGLKAFDLSGNEVLSISGMDIVGYLRDQGIRVEAHDRTLEAAVQIGVQWMVDARLKSRQYLTLGNNIHILTHDIEGTLYKKGDFLVNILFPTGFVLFDGNSHKPKKWFAYYGSEIKGVESHHPMIDGNNLIVFLNRVKEEGQARPVAKVVSYDLITEKINWVWPKSEDELKIYSPSHGGIFNIDSKNFLVYTMYDKFVLLLNTEDFSYRYLLRPSDQALANLAEGRELVDLKLIPYSDVEGFKNLKLDLFSDEWVNLPSLLNDSSKEVP